MNSMKETSRFSRLEHRLHQHVTKAKKKVHPGRHAQAIKATYTIEASCRDMKASLDTLHLVTTMEEQKVESRKRRYSPHDFRSVRIGSDQNSH